VSRRFGVTAAATAGAVVFGLLSYSFAIAIALPGAQRAGPLATIATGIAMASVALFAYKLNLRSHDLEQRTFQAAHEPSLGIHWLNRATYASTEVLADGQGGRPFYEEFLVWNAGVVPILLWQPSRVLVPELGPTQHGGSRVEVEKVQGGDRLAQKAFPIVLAKGETCIWRQFTMHNTTQVTMPSTIVARTREEAIKFLLSQEGDLRFLYQLVYFSKPPADVSTGDVYEQYVGFSYRLSLSKGND